MKRRAIFTRPLFHGRELSVQGRVSLLALFLAAVLLTAGLVAGDGLKERLDGPEEVPAQAETAADMPAPAHAPQDTEALTPALAEDDPEAGLSQAEAEAEAEAEAKAETEAEAEDGQALRQEPQIDLRRLITGEAAIIRPYGFDFNPNTEDFRFHRGSDLAAASGQPVFAPAAGTVREAREDAYWGGVLVIDFEGWSTVLRCVTPRVEAGAEVKAGDFIASVAPAPAEAAEESHFHVEVESEGSSLDPKFYF